MKAYYDMKPAAIEAVGNGNWLYRQEIEETEFTDERGSRKQWQCEEYLIEGAPDYGKCVSAVIRAKYGIDAELALVNKYASYKQGIIDDSTIEAEYAEYLTFVKDVKETVKAALGIESAAASAPEDAGTQGTADNPVPYEQGMALEKGKYYVQYDVVYECVKGTSGVKKDLYQLTAYATAVDNG